MDIYQQKNDLLGLGHAHRNYAELLKSPAVTSHEKFYREHGFIDNSVTFDNRLEKASEHYKKALEYYYSAEAGLQKAEQYDALTNLYYHIAWMSCSFLEKCQESCVHFDKALAAYEANMRRNPSAKPYVPPPYKSVPEFIRVDKEHTGCQ